MRYGARPLKRTIERELLAPLAASVNTYPAEFKLQATAGMKEGKLDVAVRAQVDSTGKAASVATSASDLAVLASACPTFRREEVQCLEKCSAFLAVQNQLFLLQRDEGRKARRGKAAYDARRAEQIRELKEIVDPAEALSVSIRELEDEIMAALYGSEPVDRTALHMRLAPLRTELRELLLALLARQTPKPNAVTVAIFGDRRQLWEMARAYHSIALANGCSARLFWFSRYGPEHLRRHPNTDHEKFMADPDEKAIGVAMGFSGKYVSLRFSAESGIHAFVAQGQERLCMVDTTTEAVADYEPPPRVEFPEHPAGDSRREYKLDEGMATDSFLNQKLTWSGRNIEPVIAEAMALQLERTIRGVLAQ